MHVAQPPSAVEFGPGSQPRAAVPHLTFSSPPLNSTALKTSIRPFGRGSSALSFRLEKGLAVGAAQRAFLGRFSFRRIPANGADMVIKVFEGL